MNRSLALNRPRTFNAHETHRLRQLDGVVLAPFWRRAAAIGIDAIGVFILAGIVAVLWLTTQFIYYYMTAGLTSIEVNIGYELLENHWVQFAITIGYFGLITFFTNGQTLGKHVMSIRVLSTVHERLSLWHAIERGLGYLASMLEFGFGFAQFFINPNRRCVHDRIAETIVVQVRTTRRIDR